MSIMKVPELQNLFEELSHEYEFLTENKNRLEADCNKLREYIENQIEQIQHLNTDFEKLKQDYLQRTGEIARQPQQQQTSVQPVVPVEQQQNYLQRPQEPLQQSPHEEQAEQDWELLTLKDKIPKPVIINLLAEIVDTSVICSTAFSPDGTCLAIGSDKTLRVYNIDKDDFLLQYQIEDSESSENNTNHVRSISWTSDSKQIVCGGEDGQIRIFELPSENLIKNFPACNGEVFQVQISNNGQYFATATGDGTLSIFSMSTYQPIATMPRDTRDPVVATSLAISSDDQHIAVGYSDNYVVIWDTEKCQKVCEQSCHTSGVYAVKFLPEYKRFVTASLDNTVKIWNIAKQDDGTIKLELWKSLDGHTNFVLSLATDPTDTWLLSGSKDLTARLSYIETGEMIYSIKAHTNSVITVAFNPNGNMFCTGSGDHSVKIWSLNPEEPEEPE
ncbi:hypothetical protein M9Y10_008319 [Tritrichomonas musculus]|uniref:Anaphase-promoting complex subunit 4-like WD40 domain-containing protein n=1 Tax=Tritrichomonas musculus TaxID=1915356 RepID=A0ABR2IYK9_9EUKA